MGRAWGNALGGWRLQGRGPKGRWLPKGVRGILKSGSIARRQYVSSSRNASTAKAAAHYMAGSMSAARQRGFFIAPSVSINGGGIEAGYGRKVSKNLRANVSIKVSVNRTDGGLVKELKDSAADRLFEKDSALSEFIKKGSYDPGLKDTAVVAEGGRIKVVSGKKANKALRKNKASQANRKKNSKGKTAQRKESRGTRKSPVQKSVSNAARLEREKRARQARRVKQARGRYAGGRSVSRTITP